MIANVLLVYGNNMVNYFNTTVGKLVEPIAEQDMKSAAYFMFEDNGIRLESDELIFTKIKSKVVSNNIDRSNLINISEYFKLLGTKNYDLVVILIDENVPDLSIDYIVNACENYSIPYTYNLFSNILSIAKAKYPDKFGLVAKVDRC